MLLPGYSQDPTTSPATFATVSIRGGHPLSPGVLPPPSPVTDSSLCSIWELLLKPRSDRNPLLFRSLQWFSSDTVGSAQLHWAQANPPLAPGPFHGCFFSFLFCFFFPFSFPGFLFLEASTRLTFHLHSNRRLVSEPPAPIATLTAHPVLLSRFLFPTAPLS